MAKASDNLLLVRWDQHQAQLLERLCGYFTDNAFVDVTLWCPDRRFKAHRVLLSACSDYLERVLLEQPCNSAEPVTVVLHGVEPDDLGRLLDLIYRGEARVTAAELPRFLETAAALGVRLLQSAALRVCAAEPEAGGAADTGRQSRGSAADKQEHCFEGKSLGDSQQSSVRESNRVSPAVSASIRYTLPEKTPVTVEHRLTMSKEQLPSMESIGQESYSPKHHLVGAETLAALPCRGLAPLVAAQSDATVPQVERETTSTTWSTPIALAPPLQPQQPQRPAADVKTVPLLPPPLQLQPPLPALPGGPHPQPQSLSQRLPAAAEPVSRLQPAGLANNVWQVPTSLQDCRQQPQAPPYDSFTSLLRDAALPADRLFTLKEMPPLPSPIAPPHAVSPVQAPPQSDDRPQEMRTGQNAKDDQPMAAQSEPQQQQNDHQQQTEEQKLKQRGKQNSCSECGKTFATRYSLKEHMRTHTGEKPHLCAQCGKRFSQRRNYRYHLSLHSGSREFAAECPECGKTFSNRSYLSSHMKIHRNQREYACGECGRRFNQRVAYNMHVRIHSGDRPHRCSVCDKAFSRKVLLNQHMRTHTGEKPFTCQVCDKQFADRSNMALHARSHWGIKPYNCHHCGRSFSRRNNLRSHMVSHMPGVELGTAQYSPTAPGAPAPQQRKPGPAGLRSTSVIIRTATATRGDKASPGDGRASTAT